MKVTLKGVYRDEELKSTKYGEKQGVALKVEEDTVNDINGDPVTVNDRAIRGLFSPNQDYTASWKPGDVVNIKIVENGDYLNFTLTDEQKEATPAAPTSAGDKALEARVAKLEEAVFNGGTKATEPEPEAVDPTDDF